MAPEAEVALLTAKFDEAAAWPEGWCCDGLDDYDEFPTPTLAIYRSDFADIDEYPVFVEVEFFDRAEPSRAEPSRAEPSRAEPSRAEPSRAEPRDDAASLRRPR